MEMWERGKKRKVSASCEKQEVYHNNHRRLNMYMTDTEMLPKIINFCLYNINVTDFFFYRNMELKVLCKLKIERKLQSRWCVCERNELFTCKVWEAIP